MTTTVGEKAFAHNEYITAMTIAQHSLLHVYKEFPYCLGPRLPYCMYMLPTFLQTYRAVNPGISCSPPYSKFCLYILAFICIVPYIWANGALPRTVYTNPIEMNLWLVFVLGGWRFSSLLSFAPVTGPRPPAQSGHPEIG